MDPRIIDLYNDELLHFMTEAAEFAREFPERAGRLSLDENRVEDPYVERLLEGVAFLAARVRLKVESQYPVFTQQLLEVLFPGWLAPSPSACVLRLSVDATNGGLDQGVVVPKGSHVVGSLKQNDELRCDFETCRTGTHNENAGIRLFRRDAFRMPALPPLFAHRRILRATDRRDRHVAGHADVAADAFADVVYATFLDLLRQKRIGD